MLRRCFSCRKQIVRSWFLFQPAAMCFLVLWLNTNYVLDCDWGRKVVFWCLWFCCFTVIYFCFFKFVILSPLLLLGDMRISEPDIIFSLFALLNDPTPFMKFSVLSLVTPSSALNHIVHSSSGVLPRRSWNFEMLFSVELTK